MDERRLRRDSRLDDASWPAQSEDDGARDDWNTFRDRVDHEWRSRRASADQEPEQEAPAAVTGENWLHPNETTNGGGPADFSVSDFRQRLLGGPGAELFGGASGPLYDSAEFAAFSVEAEAEVEAGAAAAPLAALPEQSKAEYSDYGASDYNGSDHSGQDYGSDYSGSDYDAAPEYGQPEYNEPKYNPPAVDYSGPGYAVERQFDDEQGSGLVRPYFRTRGRTKPTYDLAIEALISTSEHGRLLDRVRVPENRSICDLCLDTRSVAEVAALLRLPLGVVRVLIGDVAGLGLVLVHTSSAAVGDRPSIEFMERVLSGLRRI